VTLKIKVPRKIFNMVRDVLSGKAVYPIPVPYTGPAPLCDAYKRVAEHPTDSWLARWRAEQDHETPGVE
jgi:hypothetical protein